MTALIAMLVFVLGINLGFAQQLVCIHGCTAEAAFSVETVALIQALGVEHPVGISDFRWHEREPRVFMLGKRGKHYYDENPVTLLETWAVTDRGYGANTLLVRQAFTQMELTADTVILGDEFGSLLFWHIVEKRFVNVFSVSDGAVTELLLHPSGQWLLVAIDERALFRFDLESHLAAEIHLQGADDLVLDALAFSTAGHLLANAGKEAIRIWDTGTWEEWEPQYLSSRADKRVLFTDDDSHLMVLADAAVSRWTLANKQLTFVRELEAHRSKRLCPIADGDISPDGTLLMTIDACNLSRAWDLAADAEIYVPQLDFLDDIFHGAAVAFSPDGRFLAEVADGYWVLFLVGDPM